MISLCWFAVVFADFGIYARTCCEIGQLFFRYVPIRHSKVFPLWDVKLSAVKNNTIPFFCKNRLISDTFRANVEILGTIALSADFS